MTEIIPQPGLFENVRDKTVIVTGGAGGIGAETVILFHRHGANVVVCDLPAAKKKAESLISSLSKVGQVEFHPTNIIDWAEMKSLYTKTIEKFGGVDIVVANAGLMETEEFFNFDTDENNDLKEPKGAYEIIDINLKGTMNTLKLAMHHMRMNPEDPETKSRGSVLLVSSPSGYFGGTGVVSYVSSKHGVIGLLRASQLAANRYNIRVNSVAPFLTPTQMTNGYSDKWLEQGIPANTPADVAFAIVQMSVNTAMKGKCCFVAGKLMVEIEARRTAILSTWLGEEVGGLMKKSGQFFEKFGYQLPKPRVLSASI